MSKSLDTLEAEIEAIREATRERVGAYDRRIDGLHDSIGTLRGRAEANAGDIKTLSVHLEEAVDDIGELRNELKQLGTKIDDGFDKIREGQAEWITDLSTKLWRAAGSVALIILAILGLVLHG